jgi:hypothetical protein
MEASGDKRGARFLPGQVYFGLSSRVTCSLIQQMDGADKCVNYVMKLFGQPGERVKNLSRSGIGEERLSSELLPAPKIAYDDNGAPLLPIKLTAVMFVIDLGHIVTDRPGFHTNSYIYPAGFKSLRLYWSIVNPPQKIWYTSEIVDTGAKGPLFRVTLKDHPEISFEGNSPASAWRIIAMRVIEASNGERGTVRMSGPDCIGLSFPVVRYLIQRMDGAERCVNYVMQRFEQPGV